MARDAFQLGQGAAAIYEDQKVKAIFRPLAEATLDMLAVSADDRVLDIACGTGIVARTVRQRFRPDAPVVGIDLNEGMIETARAVTAGEAEAFRWHVGDATRLPFPDGGFTLAICQQGLQFFPDEAAALREMRRVLGTQGRVALTIWAEASPLFIALAEAIERHVSVEEAQRSLAPFSYPGLRTLPAALGAAGFAEVTLDRISVDRIIPANAASIANEIMGAPVGAAVAARGEAAMAAVIAEVLDACREFQRADDLIVPQVANLFVAAAA